WAGSGVTQSSAFTAQTYQVRVISQINGYVSIDNTTGTGISTSTFAGGTYIAANTASVELVWDRDTDTVYVSRCHRLKEATPIEHAAAIRAWGRDLRWAWPRDGKRETRRFQAPSRAEGRSAPHRVRVDSETQPLGGAGERLRRSDSISKTSLLKLRAVCRRC